MHNSRKSSWKDNIITEEPEEKDPLSDVKDQPHYRKELKSEIVEVVEENEISSIDDIVEKVGHTKWVVRNTVKELKKEGVLEVEK